jgi:hypothetical protein
MDFPKKLINKNLSKSYEKYALNAKITEISIFAP